MEIDEKLHRHMIALKLTYTVSSITVKVKFKTKKHFIPKTTGDFVDPARLAGFLSNIQTLYERICDTLSLQPHVLALKQVHFPDEIYEFEGVHDATQILKDLLIVAPDYIDSIGKPTDLANGNGGVTTLQREQSTRQLEILTPIINDLAKMMDPLVPDNQRRSYIARCLVTALDGNVNLSKAIEVSSHP